MARRTALRVVAAPHTLTRDDILGSKLRTEVVPTPEWAEGGSVIVRALSGSDRDAYDQWQVEWAAARKSGVIQPLNHRARLAALSVVDEDGRRLFTDADMIALGETDAAPLDRIFDVARRLSKLVATQADLNALADLLSKTQGASAGSG